MSGWTDAHCHLQDEFMEEGGDAPAEVRATLERAYDAGVDRVVVIGTGAKSSEDALALTGTHSPVEIYATVGLHPHAASEDLAPIAALARQRHTRLVGIGECGLDYFYEHSPRAEQRRAFAEQIALAHRHRLTLVIHARDAWDDLFAVLASEGVPERTVLHCFTGGPDEAVRCLEAGTYLSFSGIVTFKNADELRQAAALCPEDRLLVETDSPFLTPVPHRGRPNEPAFVPLVGARVAEVRQVAPEELARTTTRNALAAFDR